MNTTQVLLRLVAAVSLRKAWLMRRACRPMCESPISPSISALGTSAATESTSGGGQNGKPSVAPGDGTESLSRVPRTVRREPALLGTKSAPRTGLSALDIACLEDAGKGCLGRLE